MTLTAREFHGEEFYAYCQQQYDEARHYLKNCGKPKDDFDRFFINHHKDTVKIFSKLLGKNKHV